MLSAFIKEGEKGCDSSSKHRIYSLLILLSKEFSTKFVK